MAKFLLQEEDPSSRTIKIHPNAEGSCGTDWEFEGDTKIDSVIDEDSDTYISLATDNTLIQSFSFATQEDIGEITNIKLSVAGKLVTRLESEGELNLYLAEASDCTSYVTYSVSPQLSSKIMSHALTENPFSSATWEWSDISSLEFGVQASSPTGAGGSSPEIRVHDIYLQVTYDPTEQNPALNMPVEIRSLHSRNTGKINFWNGTREVFDKGRSSKGLTLTGIEYETGSLATLETVRELAKYGSTIYIDDFSQSYFNGRYKIKGFTFVAISEKPEVYEYTLELENLEE